ncbi:MAG: peptidoglycan bridge formation glycyltransferase FemA/FemB family protein [Firmicutes bacterium]|nr:peptidoglycan bridge formation glycyltransferase FemA/FemB family protein [Bacillota bacterium]
MRVKILEEADVPLWENFVKSSRNGTFMQHREFLNYHPKDRFKDCSLMVFNKKAKLLAVLPAAEKMVGKKKELCSHPGASHGGIIISHGVKTECMLEIVAAIKEFAKLKGFNAIELKLVPRIYYKWPCDEIDFALRYHGFKIQHTELATAVPLQEYHANKASSSVLRNVKKALKNNLVVKESDDFSSYWSVLTENLKTRHCAKPTHTYAEMMKLCELFKDKIKLFGVYSEDQLIAGTVVFILNERVINCFYIAQNDDYQSLRPLNLLFNWLIKWGIKHNFAYLDWGISTENKGRTVNSGLFNFKEGFGGRGVLRETYAINLK